MCIMVDMEISIREGLLSLLIFEAVINHSMNINGLSSCGIEPEAPRFLQFESSKTSGVILFYWKTLFKII